MNKHLMRFLVLACIILGYSTMVSAQLIHIPTDIQGRRLKAKNYVAVKGSPYLFENWSKGTVKFMNGTVFEGMLKYDQIEDELTFNSPSNEDEALGFKDPIIEFTIADPTSKDSPKERTFKKGFGTSPVDKQSNNLFFEVLVEGNAHLLKHTQKTIVEQTPYNSATTVQHIKEVVTYYLSENGSLTKFKPNEKQVLATLSAKATELQKHIKENDLNIKEEEDLKKLFVYYNTIK